MFHRIPVAIIDMMGVIQVIANSVFPESSLPDASFAFGDTRLGTSFGGREFLHETDFDGFPAIGKIGVFL